jgi:hypothetical protein
MIPKKQEPCVCGHSKKVHRKDVCGDCFAEYLLKVPLGWSFAYHYFKLDNLKYIELCDSYLHSQH